MINLPRRVQKLQTHDEVLENVMCGDITDMYYDITHVITSQDIMSQHSLTLTCNCDVSAHFII